MEIPVGQKQLSDTQRAELYEEGIIRIIDESAHQEIKLDLKAGVRLYTFIHFHDHIGELFADVESE